MNRKRSPWIRRLAGFCLCVFCLLRPLWGWMDRKAEEPQAKPAEIQETGEPVKREVNVLDEMMVPKLLPAATQAQGAKNE
jgi:hypothetical protein